MLTLALRAVSASFRTTVQVSPATLWGRRGVLGTGAAIFLLLALAHALGSPGGAPAHRIEGATAVSLLPLLGMLAAVRAPAGRSPAGSGNSLEQHRVSAGACLAAAAVLAAGHAVLGLVVREERVHVWDANVLSLAYTWPSGGMRSSMALISRIGGPWLPVLLPLVGVSLLLLRQPRAYLFGWLTILSALAVPEIFKALWHRQRPYPGGHAFNSFPSGHTMTATVVALTLAIVLLPRCRAPWQKGIVAAAVVGWPLLMGVSRVTLGCHYPTDVVAGGLLGAAWVSLCAGVWQLFAGWEQRFSATH